MNVIIFTEAGSKIGLGHLIRCTSLYDELISRGLKVELIVNGDKTLLEILKNRKVVFCNWMSTVFLNNAINNNSYCIVDSYMAKESICKFISLKSKKTLFIDDYARIKYPENSFIVNPSLYTESLNYTQGKNIKYLLGPKYVILRKEFYNTERLSIRKDVKEIMLTMGGSDILNLTYPIIKLLDKQYPNLIKHVIISNSFKNIGRIKNLSCNNIQYYYNVDASKMKQVMLKSDITITSSGQTIYELLVTNTPFIPIKVIDNQENNIKGLIKYKLISNDYILDTKNINFNNMLQCKIEYLMNYNNRYKLYNEYKKIVDGLGTKRIINLLLE